MIIFHRRSKRLFFKELVKKKCLNNFGKLRHYSKVNKGVLNLSCRIIINI